jgi:hypothetical protein
MVVLFHCRVPSVSGRSVGTVNTEQLRCFRGTVLDKLRIMAELSGPLKRDGRLEKRVAWRM